MRDHRLAPSQGFTSLAGTQREPPLAAALIGDSSEVAQGILLIPVSGHTLGVVCDDEEQNDETVSATPRSVL